MSPDCHPLRRAAMSLALASLLAACADPLRSPPGGDAVLLPTVGGTSTTRSDRADIVEASLRGDLLRVEVSFGGGCAEHDFALVHTGEFMESEPVQTVVNLAHDGHGDMCRALLRRELAFDLGPVKRAYRRNYGEHGRLTLHLRPPGGGSGAQSFDYEF
jgi:hypothetical protein